MVISPPSEDRAGYQPVPAQQHRWHGGIVRRGLAGFIEERETDGVLVYCCTQCEQYARGAARQVHREPEQLLTGEGQVSLVVDAMPVKAPDLCGDFLVPHRLPGWV